VIADSAPSPPSGLNCYLLLDRSLDNSSKGRIGRQKCVIQHVLGISRWDKDQHIGFLDDTECRRKFSIDDRVRVLDKLSFPGEKAEFPLNPAFNIFSH
jgi:hypothetical protein